ncbi:hypothetical protein [Actinomadura sp. WMMA1423]|uniref:hypothetical protein n=1 Tax=Actinomadura sp. WMMA1423 TaxID=2591108 RepID=UPI001146A3F5|nr:hypothetical protein [Actinomadura sp. WMMA1423]
MTRKTDLLEAMAAARPDRLDPPADPGRLERLRAVATAEAEPSGQAPRGAPRHRPGFGLGRPGRFAAAACAAVSLAAGLFVLTRQSGGEPAPSPARSTLLAAASTLEAGSPAPGRYWTAEFSGYSLAGFMPGPEAGPPPPTAQILYRFSSTCEARVWAARQARDPSWVIIDSVTDRRLSRADERAWRRAGARPPGSCDIFRLGIGLSSPPPVALALERSTGRSAEEGGIYPAVGGAPITLDQIAALPTEPKALRAALDRLILVPPGEDRARWKPGPSDTADAIAELLVSAPTPPALQAALYRVLAELPIDRGPGTVTDRLGRSGVAFWIRQGPWRMSLIIDPRTGRPLGVEEYLDGRLESYTIVRRQGWTDARPVLPARRM